MSSENEKNNVQEEVKRQPEGYETIISESTFNKVLEIRKLVRELTDEISKENKERLHRQIEGEKLSPYQMFQHTVFLDKVTDMHSACELASQVHELSKEFVDETAKEQDLSVEAFVHKQSLDIMLHQLFS